VHLYAFKIHIYFIGRSSRLYVTVLTGIFSKGGLNFELKFFKNHSFLIFLECLTSLRKLKKNCEKISKILICDAL
jgi:hypothetical protein